MKDSPLIKWHVTELDRAEEQLGMAEESIRELQVQIAGLQAQLTVERAKREERTPSEGGRLGYGVG